MEVGGEKDKEEEIVKVGVCLHPASRPPSPEGRRKKLALGTIKVLLFFTDSKTGELC